MQLKNNIYFIFLFILIILSNKLFADGENKYAFLLIDTNKEIKNSKITKEYLKDNFTFQYYEFNKDKNVKFDFVIPKKWEFAPNMEKNNSLSKNKNQPVLLGIIDTKNEYIDGFIYGSFLNNELNSRDYGKIIVESKFGAKVVFENINVSQSGADSDFVAINRDKNIIRGATFKDGKYYYLFLYFSKNINEYLENIRNINVSIQSFKLTEKTDKLYSIDFNNEKITIANNTINFLFPKGSTFSKKIEDGILYIDLKLKNGTTFLINILPSDNFKTDEVAKDFIEQLKNNNIILSDINSKNFIVTKSNNIFYNIKGIIKDRNFILNGRTVKRENKIINIAVFNIEEEIDMLTYYEDKRVLDVILNSIRIY